MMDCDTNFLETCRIDPSQISLTERYFTPKVFEDKNQCILLHSNRLCIVTLAPTHPILLEDKEVVSVDFDSVGSVNRLSNKVSGKFKRGGQKLNKNSILCVVKCTDDSEYSISSCISGKLVEVNETLLEKPNLLKEMPWSNGYIAIILPPFTSVNSKQNLKSDNCS